MPKRALIAGLKLRSSSAAGEFRYDGYGFSGRYDRKLEAYGTWQSRLEAYSHFVY